MEMSNSNGRQIASRAEFARLQGVSRPAVTQWAAAGRLVLTEDGRVDVLASQVRLAATQTGRGGKQTRGGASVAQPGRHEQATGQASPGSTLTDARRIQVIQRAKLDQLEFDERSGRKIDKARVDAEIADSFGPIMAMYDSLSTHAAPELVGLTDVRQIQTVLDKHIAGRRQDTADALRAIVAGARSTRQ